MAEKEQLKMPVITLVRHAEATHNAAFNETKSDFVFMDAKHQDAHLTEKGVNQATEVGKDLEMTSFDAVFCSPLTRCIQTMECIIPFFYDKSVITLHDNLLEKQSTKHICNKRKTRTELIELYPNYQIVTNSDLPPSYAHRESDEAVAARMSSLIKTICDNHDKDEKILIVSHYNAILALTGVELPNAGRIVLKY